MQLELVTGVCADDNISSRLVGEVLDVVGMVADCDDDIVWEVIDVV